MFQVTAHEDQAPGTELAFGGSDAGLCALDLAFKCCFSEALGFQQLLFSYLELLVEGLLAWEAADEHERANGSLFREIQFALPRELNEQERRELASGFARRLTEGERLPYTLAIHRGGPDGENPHAHLMVSERGLDGHERSPEQWFRRYNRKAPEKGGAKKSRTMMSREWVKDTREAWERAANEALERAGREERVDHRSLASLRDEAERSGDLERAAELSREPNVHLGPEAYRAGDLERVGQGGWPAHRSGDQRGFGSGRAGGEGQSRRFGRSGTVSSIGSRRGLRRSIGSSKSCWRRYEW